MQVRCRFPSEGPAGAARNGRVVSDGPHDHVVLFGGAVRRVLGGKIGQPQHGVPQLRLDPRALLLERRQLVAGALALLPRHLRLSGVARSHGIADLLRKRLDPAPAAPRTCAASWRCSASSAAARRTSSAGTPLRARAASVASRSVRRRRTSIIGSKLTGGAGCLGRRAGAEPGPGSP